MALVETVSPHRYRYDTDTSWAQALNRMYDDIGLGLIDPLCVDVRGDWDIDETVRMQGHERLHLAGRFVIADGAELDVMITIDCTGAVFEGRLEARGFRADSGTHYVSRKVVDGIHILQANATQFTGGILVDGCKRWGIRNIGGTDAEGALHFALIAHLGQVKVANCGSYGGFGGLREVTFDFDTATNSSGPGVGEGSPSQTCVLSNADPLTPMVVPPELQVDDFVFIDGRPHEIVAVGEDTVTVFPWVYSPDPQPLARTGISAHGGGVQLGGSNSGGISARVYAIGCGVGVLCGSSYGTQLYSLTLQACAIGMVLGRHGSDINYGSAVHGFYCEEQGMLLHLLQVSRNPSRADITGIMFIDMELVEKLVARKLDGSRHPTWARLEGVTLEQSPRGTVRAHGVNLPDGTASTRIGNSDLNNRGEIWVANPSLVLEFDPDVARLCGMISGQFRLMGPGGSGPSTVTLTVDAGDVGGTVMGESTLSCDLSALPIGDPMLLTIVRDVPANNWIVVLGTLPLAERVGEALRIFEPEPEELDTDPNPPAPDDPPTPPPPRSWRDT